MLACTGSMRCGWPCMVACIAICSFSVNVPFLWFSSVCRVCVTSCIRHLLPMARCDSGGTRSIMQSHKQQHNKVPPHTPRVRPSPFPTEAVMVQMRLSEPTASPPLTLVCVFVCFTVALANCRFGTARTSAVRCTGERVVVATRRS